MEDKLIMDMFFEMYDACERRVSPRKFLSICLDEGTISDHEAEIIKENIR